MPHPRAKVRTQMPLPWDVLDKQMPGGGTQAIHARQETCTSMYP